MFTIQLQDTNREENNDIDVVVKNTPFLIVVNASDKSVFSFLSSEFSKEAVVVQLVYDDDSSSELGVTYRKTKPLDYNIYLKERSMTIETRLHVLSSKHENNCFRVSVDFNNSHLVTDSIKCVSKLDSKRKRTPAVSPPVVPNSPELSLVDDQHTVQTAPKSTGKRKQAEPTPSSPIVPTATVNSSNNNTNNNNANSTVNRAVKKLRAQQKKDRELISLLYKQNLMLLNQVNSLTNGLNSLITVHNESASQPSSPNSMFSPVSPSANSTPTSPSEFYPTINADAGLDSISSDQYNFTMPSTDSSNVNATANSCMSASDISYQCRSDMSNPINVTDFSIYNDQVTQNSNYGTSNNNINNTNHFESHIDTSPIIPISPLYNSSYSHSILDLNNLDFISNNNSNSISSSSTMSNNQADNQEIQQLQQQIQQQLQQFINAPAYQPQQVSDYVVY
ncbi:hypothetical protein PPL_01091 [Heterostelium album PN500]|uniref:Uncharacterized protein n=1 Tax=Heterostelium pallidum (strain ATCC 26659 / Pp 5 / PN500) TaxID=670386 RepID=D3AY32_HETP5|nr:hypothetical protein PPL_01091 [Heterostelium album PN500]EFA85859.1 hypothetical protein PPL_01091 [Heterostelium album PN500]|eukprot:XP_020437965.1 hypothetical protein PPL_01091 [Heterostelium album PN500]